MINRLIIAGLLCLSLPTYAAETISAVEGLIIEKTSDRVHIVLEDATDPFADGCVFGVLQVNGLSLAGSQIMFSGLLAAHTTGGEVSITYVIHSPSTMLCDVTNLTIL